MTVRTMTAPSPANGDMSAATKAASDFRAAFSEDDAALLQAMHVAVVASLFSDIVAQIERITESTNDLARLACFKKPERNPSAVVINIED